jgi:hypothetical protein
MGIALEKSYITFITGFKRLHSEAFVIKVKYGGLGDHLFWSHLPRIAKTVGGYKKVYISNYSDYNRHPDYRKLVWEPNPFVDGFCGEDTPSTDVVIPAGINLLDAIMLANGLDDGERFHEPEFFYRSRPIENLKTARVFDPNYVSCVGAISNKKLITGGFISPKKAFFILIIGFLMGL